MPQTLGAGYAPCQTTGSPRDREDDLWEPFLLSFRTNTYEPIQAGTEAYVGYIRLSLFGLMFQGLLLRNF